MGGECGHMGKGEESCIWLFVGKPEGKRKIGRPRCRWENNIKVNLEDIGQGAWTGLMWLKIWKTGRFL